MLSGYCRLTYSLTVVMLETTQSINMFMPMLITMTISYGVGKFFTKSLYDRALRSKQVPFLKNHVPRNNKDLRGSIIMQKYPITLKNVSTCREIYSALKFGYTWFPVVN